MKPTYERLAMTHKCPVCKKRFYMSVMIDDWGYTSRQKNAKRVALCSYTCLRKFEGPMLQKEHIRIQKEMEKAWKYEAQLLDVMPA